MKPAAYSVAIVGAGPAGLTLANFLGKAGVRTLLIEANSATVSEPRAVSIDDESLRVTQQLGLDEIVRSETVSGYGSEYLGPDRAQFLRVKPTAQPYGHPRRNAFRQPVFEKQLREGLSRFACVETRFDCRMERFVEAESRVQLSLRDADGPLREIEAEFLIGCDGARSATREAIGAVLSGSSLDERWLIIDLEDSPSASPETIVFCDSRRPGIMLPGPRNTRRYEFKLFEEESEAQALSNEWLDSLLKDHDFVPGSRIVRKTVYHFHARIADSWGRDRVWLAGDAAHLMPPFAGQGMNGGIRDAANLAWKLVAVIQGSIGPNILASYERERRGHIGQMIRLALTMGAIFSPPSRLHGRITRGAFRALGLWPPARDWFAEMKYKPAPRFDNGFLLRRQLSRSGIVGRMLPQPKIRGLDGHVRLDDELGDGFALVAVGLDHGVLDQITLGKAWDALVTARVNVSPQDVPALQKYVGMLLLVRPDRYVMARIAPSEATAVARELDTMLAQTWPSLVDDNGRSPSFPEPLHHEPVRPERRPTA